MRLDGPWRRDPPAWSRRFREAAIVAAGDDDGVRDAGHLGRHRTEVLNAHLFESIAELRALTNQWLQIYNQERPHVSLGRVPPLTFLTRPTTAGQSPWELSA